MVYVTPTPTPINDRLNDIVHGSTLATFHGQRGGEWDTLRNTPLRVRQRLTGAGWMSRMGEKPDVFADLILSYGQGFRPDDPIEWYIKHAQRAIYERRWAMHRDRMRRTAKAAGHASYYEYRTEQARAAGFDSVWHMRKERGWV